MTIRGELRRHYAITGGRCACPGACRSAAPRPARRRGVDGAQRALAHGAGPRRNLHLSVDEVIDALYADENYRPMSLDSKVGDGLTVGEQAGTDDLGYDAVDAADAFSTLARQCPGVSRRSSGCAMSSGSRRSRSPSGSASARSTSAGC